VGLTKTKCSFYRAPLFKIKIMDRQDQLEIRAEMDAAIERELLKFCCPQQLEAFKEWIQEETRYELYWNGDWIDTKTRGLISTETLYKIFNMDFPGYDLMSIDEKKCYLLLEKSEGDNLWLVAIKRVCEKPNVWRFRKLICELKSQASDNQEVMKNILGDDVLKAIIKL
jgi:hypothetical protein